MEKRYAINTMKLLSYFPHPPLFPESTQGSGRFWISKCCPLTPSPRKIYSLGGWWAVGTDEVLPPLSQRLKVCFSSSRVLTGSLFSLVSLPGSGKLRLVKAGRDSDFSISYPRARAPHQSIPNPATAWACSSGARK